MHDRRHVAGETWIDPEELAYNTYSGAPTGSNRRGLVRFPDGKLRMVHLGVASSYSTIPAKPSHGRVGQIYFKENDDGSDAGEFVFVAYAD